MSQPPFMYGHFSGQQEQQPPNQHLFNYQPTLNPPPPYIGTPQQTLPFTGNYSVTNTSYEQNANRIPGLAFGLSPPLPTPSYRPEINPSWPPIPPVASPNHTSSQAQATPYSQPRDNGKSREHSTRGKTEPASLQQPTDNPLEEGELSEGEFEDLYEPREAGTTTRAQERSPPLRAFGFSENHVSSASDADGSSLYNAGSPREEPAVEITSTSIPVPDDEYSPEENRQPTAPQRERSGSYSPYLSPSELQRKASINQSAIKDAKSIGMQSVAQTNSVLPRKLGQAAPEGDEVHSGPVTNNKSSASIRTESPSSYNSSFQTMSEAKKKAQEAILGLWPLKIRYQTYIDEGFDEQLIKSLFIDLGLDVSMPKPNGPSHKHPGESPPASNSSTTAQAPKSSKSDLNDKSLSNGTHIDEAKMVDKPAKSAAEERKDKIARKLAAKAQKPTAVVPTQPTKPLPPTSALASAPSLPAIATGSRATAVNKAATIGSSAAADSPTPAGPSSSAKPKTRTEQNALLHQKLAALKKKEQEKAAAAAAQAAAANQPTPVQASTTAPMQPSIIRTTSAMATSTNQLQHTSSANSPQPTSITADSSRRSVSTQPPQPQPQPQPQSASKDDTTSGLSLSTAQPAQAKSRNLKRPVASDFDNFSANSSTLKRTRTQETLIIDVSDDEDVEMEIGSPTDGPATSIQTANPPGRQTPLAAYPPLSDPSSWKQRSSPASSAAQVPEKSGKLNLLHGRIEEMRKKIAEAEAKKKSGNKSSAPQTPSTQSPPAAEPTRLPKASDFKEQVRKVDSERRNRIASVDLPTIEATLKEKRDRWKELVSQAAQLELDLQAAEAEKQKLADEMKQWGDHVEGDSTESSGQSPALVNNAVADETQTAGSLGDTQSFTESRALALAPAIPDPGSNQGDATVISGATSTSDTDMDMSKPQSPNDQSTVIHEPSTESQSDTPAQTGVVPVNGTANGITERPSEAAHPTHNEHLIHEEVNSAIAGADDNESDDSADADISMQTSPAESPSSDDDSYEPQPAQISDTHGTLPDNTNDEQVVDKDPFEPNPVPTDVQVIETGLKDTNGEIEEKTTPPLDDPLSYHSPFEYFRAYRFHPRFLEAVPGGLKSMTYSSKIDPNKEICPHALNGTQCPNGNTCAYQHFESMVVPDGEIITQLGSSDMFSGEVKLRFIEGLKKVLNELKGNRVRDFDRITKAIVEYRAAFMEDKTKVLPLDGVTI